MGKKIHDNEVMNQLKRFSIPWERSREEVWKELDPSVIVRRKAVVHFRGGLLIRPVAALLILTLATGLFLRFFERHLESAYGEHLTHQLPDGSVVELNAGSSLAYHPFWWRISRTIRFEGEGFFMIQKGKKFSVDSPLAITQVLGTSFSIYARDVNYRVVCHTGKVQVTVLDSQESRIISANHSAQIEVNGTLQISRKNELPDPAPWKNKLFEYTGVPLVEVLNEIQRQYDVVLTLPENLDYRYTGDFDATRDLHTTLNLVCRPFGITFARNSVGEYQILENPGKH